MYGVRGTGLLTYRRRQNRSIQTGVSSPKKLSEREVALDLAVNRQAAFEEAANEPTLQSMVKGKGVLLYAKQ